MKKMATQDKPLEKKETEQEPPLWVFQLTPFLHVTIQKWQGEWRVDLRRQELKDGRLVPTKKGISLTIDKAREMMDNLGRLQEALDDVIAGRNTSAKVHLKGNIFATVDPTLSVPLVDIRKYYKPRAKISCQGEQEGAVSDQTLKPTLKGVALKADEWMKWRIIVTVLPIFLPAQEAIRYFPYPGPGDQQ